MDASPLLLICCDAGPAIGLGHLARCAALALAWNARGRRTLLAVGSEEGAALAKRFGDAFGEVVVHPRRPPLDSASELFELARCAPAACVVLDGYEFTAADHEAILAAGRPLLVIADCVRERFYAADVILNHNFGETGSGYARGPLTLTLAGERYQLLRPEYAAWRDSAESEVAAYSTPESPADVAASRAASFRVALTFGGADSTNLTGRAIEALRDVSPPVAIDAVVGPANPHRAALDRLASELGDRCRLIVDETNLAPIFGTADLAISAGGGTMWELAAIGTPTLVVVAAENQSAGVERFAAAGAVVNLGGGEEITPEILRAAVESWRADESGRKALGRRAAELIDGRGADRVVDALENHLFRFRPATMDDSALLLRWANEPGVRAASFRPHTIDEAEHAAWMERKLAATDEPVWIAVDLAGEPIGCVRFERPRCQPHAPGGRFRPSTTTAIVSISVDVARRGRGWGPRLILAATRRLLAEGVFRRVVAYIRSENVASQRAFVRAGYSFAFESSCNDLAAVVYAFDAAYRRRETLVRAEAGR